MNTFKVLTQSLEGKHIIEASAGTGKTYSIAILYLRMVLEKEIPVEKILVVTFTNAAVAELRVRIRSFIQTAYQHIDSLEELKNEEIKMVLENVLDKEADHSKIKDRLKLALLSMDNAQINTIHSFCQQMLSEYAFETGQQFSAELQTDADIIIEQVCHEFWRDVYAQLEVEVIEASELSMKDLKECFAKHLKGEQFASIQENVNMEDLFSEVKNKLDEKRRLEILFKNSYSDLERYFSTNIDLIFNYVDNRPQSSSLKRNFWKYLSDSKSFIDTSIKKASTAYFKNEMIPEYYELASQTLFFENSITELSFNYSTELISFALQEYIPKIQQRIAEKGILTYDSLIQDLHQHTFSSPNEALVLKIRDKFSAVFIDEFQDTDTLQFEIFDKLFVDENCLASLFLIGDPKQSIYGFRGADVDAYLKAKNKIPEGNRYTMNVNFRSNEALIHNFNSFFKINDPFANEKKIDYFKVNHSENVKSKLIKGDKNELPLKIFNYNDNIQRIKEACNAISTLLNPVANYKITNRDHPGVKPSDICVLVRKTKEGSQVKKQLQKLNIPAIQIMDESIFDTTEAMDIAYLLEAMISPQSTLIQKVFVYSFARFVVPEGFDKTTLGQDDHSFQRFFNYKNLLQSENVFVAFSQFLNDYNIRYQLTENNKTLRILSNVEQLIQILQDQQYRSQCTAQELLLWLHKKISSSTKDSTYTTEIESDEEAVQIVTIHKSKGLQYNIVFVIGIEERIPKYHSINSFKNDGIKYFDFQKNIEDKEIENELFTKQALQENRRLLYVAMTRAKYACNIFISETNYNKNHCLTGFLNSDEKTSLETDSVKTPLETDDVKIPLETDFAFEQHIFNNEEATLEIETILVPGYIKKAYSNWWKMSYSHLADHSGKLEIIDGAVSAGPYDDYIFNQLKKGAYIGTKLHSIFENINFQEDFMNLETLSETGKKEISGFNRKNESEVIEDNSPYIQQLINHCLSTKIEVGDNKTLSLNTLTEDQKLAELGFNFNVKSKLEPFKMELEKHIHPTTLKSGVNLDGILNGFIDLFFEHEGKYYILDWKSNYLGNTLDHYAKENVVNAMTTSNYHLQYLIYTVAVHKFLSSRLPDYDYDKHFGGAIYLFLRGVRQNGKTGVFFNKPEREVVENLSEILSKEEELMIV